MESVITLPPDAPVLMESTRAIGYSVETAIADIIDNSIAAKARNIELMFYPIGNAYVALIDDGAGMDKDALINAMRYGSKNPLEKRSNGDLGRFGLGLKTASLSQCRRLSVISKKSQSPIVGAQWDLDFIAKTGEWSLKILSEDQVSSCPHIELLKSQVSGTIILWEELDRLKAGEINFDESFGRQMDRVRQHLSLVFHRYIAGETGLKRVDMKINNSPIKSLDPFLIEKSTQIMDEEIIVIENQKVRVSPFILPHVSQLSEEELKVLGGEEGLRKQQGFYIYRNKRLLTWGTWFRMMRQGDLSKLARIRVDLPNSLDYLWTLDIKKSMAVPPEIVRKNLAPIIGKIVESSRRTWVYRGKKETSDSKVHIWNRIKTREGGIIYEVNRDHPLIESIISNNNGKKLKGILEQVLTQIERGLPLNQLYVDLTNDERIINDNESDSELKSMLENLLSSCKNDNERSELLRRLAVTEPFDKFPRLVDEYFKGV
jgi:hypothetical protein